MTDRRPACGVLVALALSIALPGCAGLRPASLQPAQAAWPPPLSQVVAHSADAIVGLSDGRVDPLVGGPVVLGSGFRIHQTRMIATAAHVVGALRGAASVVWHGRSWPARLLRMDAASDLALLEVAAEAPMPGLPLAAGLPAPGDWVLVLGRPFGRLPTVTTGIVSALPGAVLEPAALRHQLQINAAINPGNSGGPVIDLNGKVIGLASATVPGGHGLGFAVPVQALRTLIDAR